MTRSNPVGVWTVKTRCCPYGTPELFAATVSVRDNLYECLLAIDADAGAAEAWIGCCPLACLRPRPCRLRLKLQCRQGDWRLRVNGSVGAEPWSEQWQPTYLEFRKVPLPGLCSACAGQLADIVMTE